MFHSDSELPVSLLLRPGDTSPLHFQLFPRRIQALSHPNNFLYEESQTQTLQGPKSEAIENHSSQPKAPLAKTWFSEHQGIR